MGGKNKTVNPDFISLRALFQRGDEQALINSSGLGKSASQPFLQARVASPHCSGLRMHPM